MHPKGLAEVGGTYFAKGSLQRRRRLQESVKKKSTRRPLMTRKLVRFPPDIMDSIDILASPIEAGLPESPWLERPRLETLE
jgi:hypothetical protein